MKTILMELVPLIMLPLIAICWWIPYIIDLMMGAKVRRLNRLGERTDEENELIQKYERLPGYADPLAFHRNIAIYRLVRWHLVKRIDSRLEVTLSWIAPRYVALKRGRRAIRQFQIGMVREFTEALEAKERADIEFEEAGGHLAQAIEALPATEETYGVIASRTDIYQSKLEERWNELITNPPANFVRIEFEEPRLQFYFKAPNIDRESWKFWRDKEIELVVTLNLDTGEVVGPVNPWSAEVKASVAKLIGQGNLKALATMVARSLATINTQ